MKDVLAGRVDLLRARRSGCPELQDVLAHLLGYERAPSRQHAVRPPPPLPPTPQREIEAVTNDRPTASSSVEVPFWQPDSFEARAPMDVTTPVDSPQAPSEPTEAPDLASRRARHKPLASPAALATRLRRVSNVHEHNGDLNIERIVNRLSRGEWLHRLPRLPRRRWGAALQIIKDRTRRLVPYWPDQNLAVGALERVYPRSHFEVATLWEGASAPWILKPPSRWARYRMPLTGTPVLVLGDLGALASDEGASSRWWLEWGRRLLTNGNLPLALVPCHPGRCQPVLSEVWTILPWESASGPGTRVPSPEATERVIQDILALFSFALRVEPRMIRALRRMLPVGRADAGIEALVWQDESLIGHCSEAAMFDEGRARELREHVEQLDRGVRQKVYDLVARIRKGTCSEVWYAEVLGLEQEVENGLVSAAEHRRAERWFSDQCERLGRNSQNRDFAGDEAYAFRRMLHACSRKAFHGPAARSLHGIWMLVHSSAGQEPLPGHFDPGLLPGASGEARTVALSQVGNQLVARPFQVGDSLGSPIGLIRTRNGRIKIEPYNVFWEGGVKPAWAIDWGTDQFGAWAMFQVGDVRQKLRWIPPGRFMMGSPDDEEGRYDDEGPQHEQTIERGFWLFDTPCTQALWEVVMGGNPSRFRDPDRPVEQVSWDDAQRFVARVAELVPGLHLSLPSEAHWEHACRAGTTTARYGNELSEIAWYAENSNSQTQPVGQKRANGWGLFDLLGNVWEWCEDDFRSYPGGETAAYAGRVVRGGCWFVFARRVRAACRRRHEPGDRYGFIGFRCAESRSSGPARRVEPAASRSERGTEPRGDDEPESTNGSRWLNLGAREGDRVAFPAVVPVRVLSDLDELIIGTLTRPAWALDIGRDEHGLWAELEVADGVSQRLRWIPPGRFLMGSPEGEARRWENEGSQHEVTIERGFWMFATPCTQALWEAVMPENRSEFRSPTRPVERVSWNDCREFLARLNGRLEGLELSLPSEAQWEYACRAGTTTATFAGDLEILGTNNAPLLDGIAWYGGNCGVGFELPDGYDMSAHEEKQHDFERGGTRPVGLKRPNGWGLYDTLGNVWEWCADEYRPYSGGGESFAGRVVRGGSWGNDARGVRAASRYMFEPGVRDVSIGFRCAEFRMGSRMEGGRAGSETERGTQPPRRLRTGET
jgi:formylglycine-generating enzyme required for sulfatase activity